MKKSHDKALTKMAGKGNVLKEKNIEGPKYQNVLTKMYGGASKIPLEAVKRAAEGKGRSAKAYSKYIGKNK